MALQKEKDSATAGDFSSPDDENTEHCIQKRTFSKTALEETGTGMIVLVERAASASKALRKG